MEQLKSMKKMLTSCVEGQLTHLDTVDAKELGEAIDMIKDLSEAIYYCTITESMEKKDKEPQSQMMYYPIMYYPEKEGNTDGRDMGRREYYIPRYDEDVYYRDMDKMKGRMYYNGGTGSNSGGSSSSSGNSSSGNSGSSNGSSSNNSGTRGYTEYPMYLGDMMRDSREGRSGQSRKMYMESKEMHKDKAAQMQELEKYAQELTTDMVDMIKDATPEEKQYLSNRIAALATKIK